MGNSSSTTCCCCNGKISRCCRKDPLADTTRAIYRKTDTVTDIQDVNFTNVAFNEETTQASSIDKETQTDITDRESGQATGHPEPAPTNIEHVDNFIINQGELHLSDNGVAATVTWPSGLRAEISEQRQREAATTEALQEMRAHLTEMTAEFRRSQNKTYTSRSRLNHVSVDQEEARIHLDAKFSDLMSQIKSLATEVSTLQIQLHANGQRLEEERKQVMTFALALESRVASFASDLQKEQLAEFVHSLYRDFNIRLLGFDCGLTFLMEAGINQWSDLIGRQVELQERIRNTLIPEEQRGNTNFRPIVQVPGDIDLRAGEPLPPAVVSAIQAPVQVELEHPPREVMVREQQGDIAFKPTEQKPRDIDVRVDEALPDAVVFEIQEQPGDNQQKLHEDKHSASDLTDESDIPSSSDQTDEEKRHSGSDRSHIRGKLHLDIQQRRDQMDPNEEDKADKTQELFETTGLSSPSQTSWYTSVILDSASSRVFKADCSNSMISAATISLRTDTSKRQLEVRPWALALLKDGATLAVTSENEKQILFINVSDLSIVKTIHTSRLYWGVGEYASERLVVSCCKDEDGEASVDVITWEGKVESTLATSQKLTGLSQPHYLFVHNDDVFISDFSSDCVYRVDRNTGEMIDTMTDPQLQSPCQVSVDPAGKLYVASWTNGRVLKKSSPHGKPQPLLVRERNAESGYEHARCVSVTDTNLLVSWDRSGGSPMNSVLKAYHTQRLGNKVTWIPDYPFNIIHSKKPHV
ncbi:uncharacterized protein [Littorina saxatilis]|uniref:uncharacterized protein isoform X2 n=1 Tax=Littorina saxatilis TaxID=31220 RepID=UPI0038B5519D